MAAALALTTNPIAAQSLPRAALSGRIATEDGVAIGGVRIVVESPALQGSRVGTTSVTGAFLLDLLPPGDYTATFSKDGFASTALSVHLAAAGQARLNVVLRPATLEESVTVSSKIEPATPAAGTEVATNIRQDLAGRLPVDRSPRSVVLLAPGVNDNGPGGTTGSANDRPALMISGAPSYDSLFLVNGVVVNENLRGQPHDLFIEDAIEETTVETGRLSAELGGFTGGVVNIVTRSGGNDFSGSFRTTLTNDAWTANDPFNSELGLDRRADRVNETYEATFGGPLWRDRLWFFLAGRDADLSDTRQTRSLFRAGDLDPTPVTYPHEVAERRLEGKLTASVTPSHSLTLSSIVFDEDETNGTFNPLRILDTRVLVPMAYESSLLAANYNGVVSDQLFLEAQYSQRTFKIDQGGSGCADEICGTVIFDQNRAVRYHAPVGKSHARQEYDNESWLLRASYFLSTLSFGSHELRTGIERFSNLTRADFPFSNSDYVASSTRTILRGTEPFPVFDRRTTLGWLPVLQPNQGMELTTESVFVNDRVVFNSRWSFNLGIRYDRNDDRDGTGGNFSRTDAWSPRLAAQWDSRGDGRLVFHAGYARYVSKNQDAIPFFSTPAGQAADFEWLYAGPCVNCDLLAPTAELVHADDALGILFDWFASIGGRQSTPTGGAFVPGYTSVIPEGSLKSPSATEISLGTVLTFGSRGFVSADFLDRDWHDLYAGRLDLTTGTSTDPYGNVNDLQVVGSSSRLTRNYTAVQSQFRYQLSPRVRTAGSYTWSRLTGDSVTEIRCCAAVAGDETYPEYKQKSWNSPRGYLSPRGLPSLPGADQRHRARVWAEIEAETRAGQFAMTVLEALDSGRAYEAVGTIDPRPYVANPGYATPPGEVSYFFTPPAAFRTDTITHTDVALLWTLPDFRGLSLFVKPEIWNLFDEDGVVGVDATVLTALQDESLSPFDPFTEQPVRGVHYELGPQFGRPTGPPSYQQPRTFRIGIGVMF